MPLYLLASRPITFLNINLPAAYVSAF